MLNSLFKFGGNQYNLNKKFAILFTFHNSVKYIFKNH